MDIIDTLVRAASYSASVQYGRYLICVGREPGTVEEIVEHIASCTACKAECETYKRAEEDGRYINKR